jgi:cytochrome c oxidase subunit II
MKRWRAARLFRKRPGAEAMQKKRGEAGSTAVALIFALFIVVLTVVTVYLFVWTAPWNPGFPATITAFGALVDAQYHRTLIITGVVFVLAQLGLAWAVWKFRDQGQRVTYFEGHTGMEMVWTLATLVLFVGLGIYGERAWAEARFDAAPSDSLQIEVTGQQFTWNFRYSGPDGLWGTIKPELISASTGNPLGLDPQDPNGKDDVVYPELFVPQGRDVEVLIRTQDVTHDFYVRELRLKQDAVPGLIIHLHFNATVPGVYEIACAELCGSNHNRMRSFMHVVPQAEYDQWMQEQLAALAALQ